MVGRVARRRDGRRVRRPHRRRARHVAHEDLGVLGGRGEHLFAAPAKAEAPERAEARPIVRRKHRLTGAERVHEAHLLKSLERGHARVRYLPLVRHAGHVADREAAIVVRRPDEPVEVVLAVPRFGRHAPPSIG